MAGKLYIGTVAWSYKDWVGPFYPKGTKPNEYLQFISQKFNSVEIDFTFYRTPKPEMIDNWLAVTPEAFSFSPKFPRKITHFKRLEDCSDELEFYLNRIKTLGDKLGPLLLQFDYKFSPENLPQLTDFLPQLPQDFRYAVEVRNRKWLDEPEFFELLEKYKCAFVVQDLYYMPKLVRLTAPFVYIRLIGDRRKIKEDFTHIQEEKDDKLADWAKRIMDMLKEGIDVYVYSSNRYEGFAPATAENLRGKIRVLGYED